MLRNLKYCRIQTYVNVITVNGKRPLEPPDHDREFTIDHP